MSQSPGMSHREHEAAILGTLRRELGETKYDRWLGNASASIQAGDKGQDPHSVVIEVDNAFAAANALSTSMTTECGSCPLSPA